MPSTLRSKVSDSYLELIHEFPLRKIKSSEEVATATKLVVRLVAEQSDRGVSDYLDVLVDLIADYENRAALVVDTSKVSAADLVRHRIAERGLSVNRLARDIGVPQSNLSEMLAGKRGWSKSAIRGLARSLNISADRFLI